MCPVETWSVAKNNREPIKVSFSGQLVSRDLPGKAVVNLSDDFRVAKSQTFHLQRARHQRLQKGVWKRHFKHTSVL